MKPEDAENLRNSISLTRTQLLLLQGAISILLGAFVSTFVYQYSLTAILLVLLVGSGTIVLLTEFLVETSPTPPSPSQQRNRQDIAERLATRTADPLEPCPECGSNFTKATTPTKQSILPPTNGTPQPQLFTVTTYECENCARKAFDLDTTTTPNQH